MRTQGQWVWITGASSGIGRELAIEFSKTNCHLVLLSRNEGELQTTAEMCSGSGRKVIQTLDLNDNDSITQAVDSLAAQNIPVDILVNNGGISQRSSALETKEEIARKIFEIDYFGPVALTQLLLPGMIARGGGQVAVVTSLVGIIGSPKRTTYSAAKHALHGYFDSLRAELYKENIKVTIICPGFIRTNISMYALTASGKPQNKMDEKTDKGMSPQRLAVKVVRGILRGKEEIYVGGKEILAIYVKRFVPGIFSKILRNSKVT